MMTDQKLDAAAAQEVERRVKAMRQRQALMRASREHASLGRERERAIRSEAERRIALHPTTSAPPLPDPETVRRAAEAEAVQRAEATRLAAERAAVEKQARNRAALKRGMDAERAERNGSVAPASAPDTRAMWRKAIKGENQEQTEAKASTRDKHGLDPRLGHLMPDSPFGP